MWSWVNKLMNNDTKSAVSIISKFKLSPLAFNWFRAQPEDRVSKKAQRLHRVTPRNRLTARSTSPMLLKRIKHARRWLPILSGIVFCFQVAAGSLRLPASDQLFFESRPAMGTSFEIYLYAPTRERDSELFEVV